MVTVRDRRPLRVLHVLATFGTGGTEQGIINLINHSDPDRVRQGVVSFVATHDAESLARVKAPDFFYRPLHKGFGNDPRVVFRLRRALKDGRFDIVHSHGWPTYLETRMAVIARRGLGVIHGEHGTFHLERGRRRRAFSLFSGGFDRFLFVSERLRAKFELHTRIPPEKMQVIENGVDFDRFANGPSLREQSPEFDDGLVHVGTTGRFHPVKGHQILLDLARRAKQEGLPLKVHFAGDGELRPEYERFVSEHGLQEHVILHGTLRHTESFYRALDLFVLASESEGHPNAVLEAIASCCPVAATPVGDLPDFVRQGQNGFLFEHGDLEALLAVVLRRVGDPAEFERIAATAYEEALQRFSLGRMVEDYTSVYERLCDRERP